MIRSMTSFAREQERSSFGELTWEIRTVNSRFLELHLRMPEELRAIEQKVRDKFNARLGRGKVDVGLRYKAASEQAGKIKVNEAMLKQVLDASNQLLKQMHSSPLPTAMDMMRWPGALETEEQDFTPAQEAAMTLLDKTIDSLLEAREREGARLAELIQQRIDGMRVQVEKARERMPQVMAHQRDKLSERLAEIMGEVDKDRLEQEIALIAQRLDVDEEMDRLTTHLDEVQRVLGSKEPVGRRLDFLMQELNREANTLGSKSADTETTGISVEMKVLIEQMREQIQNIE